MGFGMMHVFFDVSSIKKIDVIVSWCDEKLYAFFADSNQGIRKVIFHAIILVNNLQEILPNHPLDFHKRYPFFSCYTPPAKPRPDLVIFSPVFIQNAPSFALLLLLLGQTVRHHALYCLGMALLRRLFVPSQNICQILLESAGPFKEQFS